MDFEDFLSEIYTPIKTIELITDIIYTKCNEDWEFFSEVQNRTQVEELLCLNFAIDLCAKKLLKQRYTEVNNLTFK